MLHRLDAGHLCVCARARDCASLVALCEKPPRLCLLCYGVCVQLSQGGDADGGAPPPPQMPPTPPPPPQQQQQMQMQMQQVVEEHQEGGAGGWAEEAVERDQGHRLRGHVESRTTRIDFFMQKGGNHKFTLTRANKILESMIKEAGSGSTGNWSWPHGDKGEVTEPWCDPTINRLLGLRWEKFRAPQNKNKKPPRKQGLGELPSYLQRTRPREIINFTRDEWNDFGIKDLKVHEYVRTEGRACYRPVFFIPPEAEEAAEESEIALAYEDKRVVVSFKKYSFDNITLYRLQGKGGHGHDHEGHGDGAAPTDDDGRLAPESVPDNARHKVEDSLAHAGEDQVGRRDSELLRHEHEDLSGDGSSPDSFADLDARLLRVITKEILTNRKQGGLQDRQKPFMDPNDKNLSAWLVRTKTNISAGENAGGIDGGAAAAGGVGTLSEVQLDAEAIANSFLNSDPQMTATIMSGEAGKSP